MPGKRSVAAALIAVSLGFASSFAAPQDSTTTTKNPPQPAASTSVPAGAPAEKAIITTQMIGRSAHIGHDVCKTHRNLPQCS